MKNVEISYVKHDVINDGVVLQDGAKYSFTICAAGFVFLGQWFWGDEAFKNESLQRIKSAIESGDVKISVNE